MTSKPFTFALKFVAGAVVGYILIWSALVMVGAAIICSTGGC